LPFAPDAGALSVEVQEQSTDSTLALYRRLLDGRRNSLALRLGTWEELPSHPQVLAYRRHCDDDERLVCINFADCEHTFPLAETWQVEIASDGKDEGRPFSGRLGAEQAVILCR
jgi:alpha-glucosidase